jgi:hypothetical protein
MKKTDPSITFLNQWGYNVVKLPRAGIEPMDVIGNDGSSRLIGPIHSMWTPDSAPEPVPGLPVSASQVNGKRTAALDISLGLSVLSGALSAFGATVPSLDVAYHQAKSVQFSYTGVTSTSAVLLDVGNYLAKGKMARENPVVQNYFFAKGAKAYLIVDVLKSNSITVTATDEHGNSIGLDVPAIEGLVGAKVKVSPSSSSSSTITYSGPEPVTFGFSVQEIWPNGDGWKLHGNPLGGDIAFAIGDEDGDSSEPGQGVILSTNPGECRLDV